MKLPDKIKILDSIYQVEYIDDLGAVGDEDKSCGKIDFYRKIIKIYRGVRTESDIYQTLIHEVLHGICDILKIKIKEDDEDEEEKIVDLLAIGINLVLHDNKLSFGDKDA